MRRHLKSEEKSNKWNQCDRGMKGKRWDTCEATHVRKITKVTGAGDNCVWKAIDGLLLTIEY